MFDSYTLKARVYPVIILFFPIFIVGVFYSLKFESYIQVFTSIGLVGALSYLMSQFGRDLGKKKEPNLWKEWGGMPSVQLLRLNNQEIDKYTKQRYHIKMQGLIPVQNPPNSTMEANNPNDADEIYKAWCKYIIHHTRDESKYQLLLKENTSYGFRRNLWGLKFYGITLTLLLFIINYLFFVKECDFLNPLEMPLNFHYCSLSLIIIIVIWLFIITKSWVKLVAFAYAERLCESIESI